MDATFTKGKIHDPEVNLDSDGSDSDMPNNDKAALRGSTDVPSPLNLIHNDFCDEPNVGSAFIPAETFRNSGPQADDPNYAGTATACPGGRFTDEYRARGAVCEGRNGDGSTPFHVWIGNRWTCNQTHTVCWDCYNSPTCPVDGPEWDRQP